MKCTIIIETETDVIIKSDGGLDHFEQVLEAVQDERARLEGIQDSGDNIVSLEFR